MRVEPAELFDRDDSTGRTGRFRPGEAVGFLELSVFVNDAPVGRTAVEVRPVKLEYEHEYRRMLRDISEFASEAIMQGFQPAAESFAVDPNDSVDLLYRRFAVLNARLNDPEFRAALGFVLGRPHNDWVHEAEWRSPSMPLRGGPELRRALVTGRPRRDWPDAPRGSRLTTLPLMVEIRRQETSVDTLPNRLVKFALEDWRNIVSSTAEAVRASLSGGARTRGLRATDAALELLDEWLAEPMFRAIGRLSTFPQGNQVLLKREGYRQLFAAWMVSSMGADVAVDLDDPVRISQRNVATLYEYWCFLQLSAVVAQACGSSPPVEALFRPMSGGMALGLRQGDESRLVWTVSVAGRALTVELFFNRSFRATGRQGVGSWSREMRPDCSLRIQPTSALPGGVADGLATWVHFDAKYRVDYLAQQFNELADDAAQAAADEEQETVGESKRADLLKMHAYRDAIRRSAGAYVLFPGDNSRRWTIDTETLPGIGAFPLRPAEQDGPAVGVSELKSFVVEVLDHVANQATRHERSRYWTERIANEANLTPSPSPPMEELDSPPADTRVLLVPFGQPEALSWLMNSRLCLLPSWDIDERSAAEPGLAARLLLLHGPGVEHQMLVSRVSEWFPLARRELEHLGAPQPIDEATLCCKVAPVEQAPWWIAVVDVEALLSAGGPLVSWLALASSASR